MKRVSIFVVFGLLLGGCVSVPGTKPPTTKTTANRDSQPSLRAIDLKEGVYLARLDIHTTITPDGLLRAVRTENRSFGPDDIDPKSARIEIREGRLSPHQMAELAAMFAGWDSLSNGYPSVPDGPELQFRYGEKTVSGGRTPEQVWEVRTKIYEWAAKMPIVDR
jgi:hypothetical protein